MSVIILVASKTWLIFDLGGLRKKVPNTLSKLELKNHSCAFSYKKIFTLVEDVLK